MKTFSVAAFLAVATYVQAVEKSEWLGWTAEEKPKEEEKPFEPEHPEDCPDFSTWE
jgi:hypothetical protein